MSNKTPAMILNELSIKQCGGPPYYNVVAEVQGTHENEFVCEVSVLGIIASARGRSKKEAKQDASRQALTVLAKQGVYESKDIPLPQEVEEAELRQVRNYMYELDDMCCESEIPSPEMVEISAVGPPHAREFTYECKIGDSIKTRATAPTKKRAKQSCAKQMIDRMVGIVPSALKEAHETAQLKLCAVDEEAQRKYDELSVLRKNQSNLSRKVCDSNLALREWIARKGVAMEELEIYLEQPWTEFNLSCFLEKLELEYSYEDIGEGQPNLHTYVLNVTLDCPLASMGQSENKEDAKREALMDMFKLISNFIH